jgi:hypothetical protein
LCLDVLVADVLIIPLGRGVKCHSIQVEKSFWFPVDQAVCGSRVLRLNQGAVGVFLLLFLGYGEPQAGNG